jgi:hypothetical protein
VAALWMRWAQRLIAAHPVAEPGGSATVAAGGGEWNPRSKHTLGLGLLVVLLVLVARGQLPASFIAACGAHCFPAVSRWWNS